MTASESDPTIPVSTIAGAPPSAQPAWLAAMPADFVARLTPPTVPGPLGGVARKTRWPGVIGSISIALGAAGLLMGAVTLFSQAMSGYFAGMVPGQNQVFAAQRKWFPQVAITQSISIAIATILFVAGIAMVRRSPRSRLLFTIWIPLRVLCAIAVTIVTYLMQRDQFAAMSATSVMGGGGAAAPGGGGGGPAVITGAIADASVIAAAVGYGLWAMIWPSFMLIWLLRPVIRAQMRAWQAAARSAASSVGAS